MRPSVGSASSWHCPGKAGGAVLTLSVRFRSTGAEWIFVWYLRLSHPLADGTLRVPVVAFEVESSWRTRKHIKGDYLNLFDLGASRGVIVLLGRRPRD